MKRLTKREKDERRARWRAAWDASWEGGEAPEDRLEYHAWVAARTVEFEGRSGPGEWYKFLPWNLRFPRRRNPDDEKRGHKWGGKQVSVKGAAAPPEVMFSGAMEPTAAVRFVSRYTGALCWFRVSFGRQGYADIPVVRVSGVYKGSSPIVEARTLATEFAETHGFGIELYNPTLSRESRRTLFEDCNPQSPTYGKRKYGNRFEYWFEVPADQLPQVPKALKEARYTLAVGPRPGEWGRKKIDEFLGWDKVRPLRKRNPRTGRFER